MKRVKEGRGIEDEIDINRKRKKEREKLGLK